MIQEIIKNILENYSDAKLEKKENHFLANYIHRDVKQYFESVIKDNSFDLIVKTSTGQGAWAHVPWIGLLSPLVTTSTQKGYFIVYYFSEDMKSAYLCLCQGVSSIKEEFKGKSWMNILENRSDCMKHRVPDYKDHFISGTISLGSSSQLAKDYSYSSVFYKEYELNNLPSDVELLKDLKEIITLYMDLINNGGFDFIDDNLNISLLEKKKIKLHEKYEGRVNSSKIKKHLGYTCKACDFNFKDKYGDLGDLFIEAHHLTPYSELKANSYRELNINKDFTVLCANCHRMIHKLDDPSDLNRLKELLRNAK